MKNSIFASRFSVLFQLVTLLIALAPEPIHAGLLAHWRFDEPNGLTAHDKTGVFPGALSPSGASFVSGGISRNALKLEKSGGGFVSMGNVLGLLEKDFSLVAWVKTVPGDTTPETAIVSKHTAFSLNGYFLAVNRAGGGGQDGKAVFYQGTVAGSPVSQTTVNDGRWHQLVAVFEKNKSKKIYVDGVPEEASKPSEPFQGNDAPFLIGGSNFGGAPAGVFTGLIDEVQVYDHALRDEEINYLYQNPQENVPLSSLPVTIQPNGGLFTNSVSVTIRSSIPGAEIRYTLDQSEPKLNSLKYSNPFVLETSVTVQARVFVNGFPASEIVAAKFTAAPTISFVPNGGLFTNRVDVLIGTTITAGTLHFTLDGSEPQLSSPIFTVPISLRESATVKARVFINSFPVSETASASFARVYAIADGVPNSWREQFFGTGYLTDPRVQANADPDNDGSTNLQEYLAGTDPLNPLSGFSVAVKAIPMISWNSISNHRYRIMRRDSLQSTNWQILGEIRATNSISAFIDSSVTNRAAFYAIEPLP